MIRSPDLSRNDGRYSTIAESWGREVALGFTPTGGLGPHLRNNRERDLGNQRILEASRIAGM